MLSAFHGQAANTVRRKPEDARQNPKKILNKRAKSSELVAGDAAPISNAGPLNLNIRIITHMALVGFFDILGTKDAVMNGHFSDSIARDFVGPVGIAAMDFPKLRFAVFSDSVIVSAEDGDDEDFLNAVTYINGQWLADWIFVRGGVAAGDIRWVDSPINDKKFDQYPNLMYARVYGKALILAHDIEQKSGPGAIVFLTEPAAERVSAINPNCVLPGATPMLCWASERVATLLVHYAASKLENHPKEGNARRQALATQYYWGQVVAQKRFLPDISALW